MKTSNISLEQLIPHPESLRLLIFHTPFQINLDPLASCINLIKLDLSNNSLERVPCLAHMSSMRFLFLHNNRLQLDCLKSVFQFPHHTPSLISQIQRKSPLAKSIVWVTFWGNKNVFYARHYLVTHTNAITVDRNIVVPEEQSQTMYVNPNIAAFSNKTLVEFPLVKIQQHHQSNNNLTQEEYIKFFYEELNILRSRYIKSNPILMIQKIFRGWRVRNRLKRKKHQASKKNDKIREVVAKWISFTKKRIKLREILERRKKAHLLLGYKEYQKVEMQNRVKECAMQARTRVKDRIERLKVEYRLWNCIRGHYYTMKYMYDFCRLQSYPRIFVKQEDLDLFKMVIIPFVQKLNPGETLELRRQNSVREVRQAIATDSPIPFSALVLPILRAQFAYLKTVSKQGGSLIRVKMKRNDKKVYLSNAAVQKSNSVYQKLDKFRSDETKALYQITGRETMLKDILRGVFFYNRQYLKHPADITSPKKKLLLAMPEFLVKYVHVVLKVQKCWRGYVHRRKAIKEFEANITRRRAAMRIQRWYRRLPSLHRSSFVLEISRFLKQFSYDYKIYLRMEDYKNLANIINQKRIKFMEQHIKVVISKSMTLPESNSSTSSKIQVEWDSSVARNGVEQVVDLNGKLQRPVFSTRHQQVILGYPLSFPTNQISLEDKSVMLKHTDAYHLLHFETVTKIISRGDKQFVAIECKNSADAMLRVFLLSLLAYNFRPDKRLKILNTSQLQKMISSVPAKNPLLKNNTQLSSLKTVKIDNARCLFMFTNGRYPLMPSALDSLGLKIIRDTISIYLKENKNSFPFKVPENINLLQTKSILFATSSSLTSKTDIITSRQNYASLNNKLPVQETKRKVSVFQFLTETSDNPQMRIKTQIEETDEAEEANYASNKPRKRSPAPQQIAKSLKYKINKITADRPKSNIKNIKSTQSYVEKKHLYLHASVHQKTEESLHGQATGSNQKLPLPEGVKAKPRQHQRFLTQTSNQNNTTSFIEQQADSIKNIVKEDEAFTNNFVNLSNFIAKQYQHSCIQQRKRRVHTQIEEMVARERDTLYRSKQKLEEKQNIKKKLLTESTQEYKNEIQKQLQMNETSQLLRRNTVMQGKSRRNSQANKGANHKVHIVFPEECYPLFPALL